MAQTQTLTGQRFRVRDRYEVGREKIREFARAVQNGHGAHHREADAAALGYSRVLAPPTFSSVIGLAATRALLDSVLTEYDISQILQTDQVFEIHRPLLAGDSVSSELLIDSIRNFGDNDFVNVRFALTNEQGEVAVSGTTTIVARRGAEVDADLVTAVENIVMHSRPMEQVGALDESDVLIPLGIGPAPENPPRRERAPHTIPDFAALAKGDELPTGTARLTRGDLANYAGVAGDPNPIHFSEHAAKLAGLPTVVAHGLLTMGLAAGYLTDWLGDPTAIEKFSVRFSGFVPVHTTAPSTVEFGGRIKSLDPERRSATVLLSGTSEGRKLFGRAVAEVRLG
ncbi:fused (3R)-hydroxyacyl-ACP dehydratase subunits HadA/HadB [Nocardia sp. NPDC050697]|uniref:fused (3R)-hydroxyacyl-ACP dehydratase subunits HadA/HadB n=1 Tax=Nocardia sp. NPDC050697 TaxID=3155158 RepID=UPI0033E0D151